jgi:hypothetical protein
MHAPRYVSAIFVAVLMVVGTTDGRQERQLTGEGPRPSPLPGLMYDVPFFPGAKYDAAIPTPDQVLGYAVGSKPATHGEIEAVMKAIAAKGPRTRLLEYGKTYEGRTLYYMVIASEANIKRLDGLKADYAKLADPRAVSSADGDTLSDSLPALAWMGYAIHGDEMSGSDAALAVAHHLAASTDETVKKMLNEIVIIIDPLMNPDGRDRWLRGIAENRTVQPGVDDQSLLHGGIWPSGRMNHYLFDLNRDWIFGVHPETRGRIAAARDWNPHYFMESHEMGSQDTFLFQPPREPINPNIPANVHKWLKVFGRDQAQALDAHKWPYYTGEWNEEWYPGYSGAWGSLRGAVENLYEQAAISTDAVRRPEGRLEPYREAVHKQLVSTMANLTSLAANRREVLRDFVAEKRKNLAADGPYAKRVFAIVPSANASRMKAFTDLMTLQGFEMHIANEAFPGNGRDRLGLEVKDRQFPAGTILIPNRQPLANLIGAMLEFDPRLSSEFLNVERRELLRFNRSKLYDITAWNITMMFDVEGYELALAELPAGAARYDGTQSNPQAAVKEDPAVAFVIDGADDRSVALAGRLMERGIWVRVSNKPFSLDGKNFARGSVVITHIDNRHVVASGLGNAINAAVSQLGLNVSAIRSGWGEGDLPDLGGEHFILLHQPRIAVLGREPFHPYNYGEVWHLLDQVLGLRASYINAQDVNAVDLRRYNVLILPHGDVNRALKDRMQALREWVQAGGTLIAIGSSAAALAKDDGIGSARLLQDVIDKPNAIEEHRRQIVREWEGRTGVIEAGLVWSMTPPASLPYPWLIGEVDGGEKPSAEELRRRDEWKSLFMPQGAIVAARIDDRSWLTAGLESSALAVDQADGAGTRSQAASLKHQDFLYLPVMYTGDTVLMSKLPVEAPLRFGVFLGIDAPREAGANHDSSRQPRSSGGWTLAPPGFELRLRMSGLLWPEAADRLAHSACVTREAIGNGQVILFASWPTFRGATLGTARVLSNAMVCGPGMGASQPIKP